MNLDLDTDHGASARILWRRADMGTGKSSLATKIGVKLLENSWSENHIALVFCSWAQRDGQTSEALIDSLLAQLYLSPIFPER